MADRIGILVEITGNGYKQLQEIEAMVKYLDGKKLNLNFTEPMELIRSLRSIESILNSIVRERGLNIGMGKVDEVNRGLTEVNDKLDKAAANYEANLNLNIQQALGGFNELEGRAQALRESLSNISVGFTGAGDALQNFGLGQTDTFGVAKRFATYGILRNLTSNNEATAKRFDILNTYTEYMKVMGYSADESEKSLNKLNEAIQGLPIGLDEGAFDIKKYTMYLGDIGKATNLAIGFDQALIAGGAPEQMRNYAKYEVERLLAGGQLATSRQWRSLLNGLGISSVVLAEQFGFDRTTKFAEALYKKEIPADKFLEALMGIPENKQIQDMIGIYKTTIESGLSNIQFAITRGKEKVLKAINDTLKSTTGKNISDYMYDFRDELDANFKNMAKWVREHPEKLQEVLDMLRNLYESFKQFPWGQLATDVLHSVETMFRMLNGIYKIMPKGLLEKMITFMLIWASPLGKVLTAIGSLFGIVARFPMIQGVMFRRIISGMNGMGGVVQGIGKFKASIKGIGTGFLGATAFLGIIAEIGAVIFEFTKVAEVIANAKLDGFWKNFGKVSGFTAIMGGIAGAMVAVFSAFSATGVGAAVVGLGELLTAGFIGILGMFGKALKVIVSLANDIAKAEFPDSFKISQFGDVLGEMSTAVSKIKITTTRNQLKKMDSGLELAKKVSETLPHLEGISKTKLNLEKVKTNLKAISDALESIFDPSSGFYKTWKSGKQNEFISNLTNAVNSLDALRTTFYHLQMSKLFKERKDGSTGLEKSVTNIKTAMKSLDDLLGEFETEYPTLAMQMYGKRSSKNWGTVLENAKNSVTAIRDIVNILKSIDFGDLMHMDYAGIDSYQNLFGNIKMLMQSLNDLFDPKDDEEGMKDGGKSWVNGQGIFTNLVSNANQMKEAIGAINSIVKTLSGMKEKIAVINKGIGLGKMFDLLSGTMEGRDFMGMSEQVGVFGTAMQRMASALNDMNEIDLSGFIGSLKTILKALRNIVKEMSNVVTASQNASAAITVMAMTASAQAVIITPLITSISTLAATLAHAAGAASSLTSAINSIPSYKKVTVNYNQRRTSGILGSLFSRWFSSGGMVNYLAEGGFPVRGTDTIPAMLTKGEFVMRRKAVNTLGANFMENINRLNIGGAIRDLMSRSSMPMGYIDNSRHYDNHATVNQTIHTQNPNYPYRRANRFVSAL